jgi:cephalosporin hydroxylase
MWAVLLDQLVPDGRVVAIDLHDNSERARDVRAYRERVDFIQGSTTERRVVDRVEELTAGKRTMVILDSAHQAEHVAEELDLYADLVSSGCYLIVQDGFVNGHPIWPDHGPGPYEAVETFLASDDRFEVDRSRERMLFTFNPDGFLRRR